MNLKLQSGTSMAEHMNEFQNLVNQLASVYLQYEDVAQALLLLSSLSDSWKTFGVSLSNLASEWKVNHEYGQECPIQ